MLGFLRATVYVKLHPDQLTVRHVESGRTVAEQPVAAVSKGEKKQVLGVGSAATAAAATQAVALVNPFKHPRTLLADFTVAQVVLKEFFRKVFEGSWFAPSPVVILHPRFEPEGGFTQIEIRALQELAVGAGASRVIVWSGRELTDDELKSRSFPSDGRILDS